MDESSVPGDTVAAPPAQPHRHVSEIRRWLTLLLASGLVILSGTTIAGLVAPGNAWTDLFADLRMQQVVGLMIVLILSPIAKRKWSALIAVTLLAVHLPWFSSAWDRSNIAEGQPDLKVMSANVLTQNRDLDSIVSAIVAADPDVFAIVELGQELADRLEQMEEYPHRHLFVQNPGNFGVGIYSKSPISNRQLIPMNLRGIVTLSADISTERGDYRVVATHPIPPLGRDAHRGRNDHLEMLAEWVNEQQEAGTPPIILVGDFNLAPWTPTFDRFQKATGLQRVGEGFGVTPTWYAKPIFPLGIVIDHGLVSQSLQTVDYSVGPDIGSDHRPILFTLKNSAPSGL